MAVFDKAKMQEYDLTSKDFKTDRAKDRAYMEHQEKADAVAQALEAKGVQLGGVEFFDHQSRRDILGESLKNYTPTMFALNSSAQNRIENPRRYFRKKGIENNLFAQTIERDSTRFLSIDEEMTNHAIALDNYDFFLKHNDEIRTNLARVMLAKLDLDIDSKKTLNDLLNDKQWREADGVEVFNELKNRLRQRGQELNDRYVPIFKLLSQSEDIAGQYRLFLSERMRVQEELYKKLSDKNDPLSDIQFKDETEKSRVATLINMLDAKLPKDDQTIEDRLLELSEKEKNSEANELYGLLLPHRNILLKNSKEFMDAYKASSKKREKFIRLHNENMEKATEAVEKLAHKSKSYPVAILAALSDKEYFLKHEGEGEYQNIEKTLKKELKKILPGTADIDHFVERLKKNIQDKKALFEHIYDPTKDSFNPQRQYIPFESVKTHDTAGNILRDMIYIESMQESDQKLFSELFDKNTQENLVSVPLDPNINDLKPKLDEVNDTFNAINAIEKVSMGEISKKEADILFGSPLFQDSSVLNSEDIDGLKEFSTNLAETTKVLKSKEIIGTPQEAELKKSIQEMHYLAYSKQILSKMRPDRREKNPLKRAGAFIGRNFFQNNKALHDMEECMKSALNPTTGVETIPSLSRGCIDKLKEAYNKEVQETDNAQGQMRGWLGVSFVGFINQMMPLIAKAKRDMLNQMIDEMNKKIAEDSIYTNNARNDYERMARMMNVQNRNGVLANHLISSSHASEFRDEIEKEHIALTLMNTKIETDHLAFENQYEINNTPNLDNRLRAEEIKDEMLKLRGDFQRLKEELIERAMKEDTFSEMAKEVESIALDNRLIEERLKSQHLLSENEIVALKKALEEGKEKLLEKREAIYTFAVDDKRFKDIKESIDHVYKTVGGLSDELKRMEKQEQLGISVLEQNDKKHRTEARLSNLRGKELLDTIVSIGMIKDDIDKKIFEGKVSGTLGKSDIEKLQRDREKAVKSINELQKRAILDHSLFAESIAQSLSKNYNINVDQEILKSEIGKSGLTPAGINHILDQAQDLSKSQRLKIRTDLFDMNTGLSELANNDTVKSKYTNNISTLLGTIKNSDMFEVFKEHNDAYVAVENMGDGLSHVRSANGDLGHYIARVDEVTASIDTEKDLAKKDALREELSLMLEGGKIYHDESGISFNEYQDIVIKQSHSANDLHVANTEVNQRSSEIRRSI